MQDFTSFNQPQPSSADGYYRDPLEAAPAAPEKSIEVKEESSVAPAAPESVTDADAPKEEPPMLSQEEPEEAPKEEETPKEEEAPKEEETPSVESEEVSEELSPELKDYLDTTQKLLEHTRKERNHLIVLIDEEEDKITTQKKEADSDPDGFKVIKYDELNKMHSQLYRKNDLISALISVIRTLK